MANETFDGPTTIQTRQIVDATTPVRGRCRTKREFLLSRQTHVYQEKSDEPSIAILRESPPAAWASDVMSKGSGRALGPRGCVGSRWMQHIPSVGS